MRKSFTVFALATILLMGSVSGVGAQSSSSGGSSLLGAFLDVVKDFAGAISSVVEKSFNSAITVPIQRTMETTRTPVIKAPTPQNYYYVKYPYDSGSSSKTNTNVSNKAFGIVVDQLDKVNGTPAFLYTGRSENDPAMLLANCKGIKMEGTPTWVCFTSGGGTAPFPGGREVRIFPPESEGDGRGSCMDIYMPPTVRVCFTWGGGSNAPIGGGSGSNVVVSDLRGYIKPSSLSNDELIYSAPPTMNNFKVKVVSPSAADDGVWIKGKQYAIKWESTDPSVPLKSSDFISIYLISAKDGSRALTISSKSYNDGEFRWTVSTRLESGSYHIVVASASNPSLIAVGAPFSIVTSAEKSTRPTSRPVGEGGPIEERVRSCCQWQLMWSGWHYVCGPGICTSGGGS